MCVGPFSVNWDCREASWQMTAAGSPNECTFPAQLFTASDASLFGQCQFTDVSQKELAFSDEVLAAAGARKDKLPIRNSVIQVREKGNPVGPGCVTKAAPGTPQQQTTENVLLACIARLPVAQKSVVDNLQALDVAYWSSMGAGTGVDYGALSTTGEAVPGLLPHTTAS